MTKVKTAISIDNDLLEETDMMARELQIPRSQMVSLALEDYLRKYHNRRLLRQINEAYAGQADAEEVQTMEIIRSHRRRSGDRDEWK